MGGTIAVTLRGERERRPTTVGEGVGAHSEHSVPVLGHRDTEYRVSYSLPLAGQDEISTSRGSWIQNSRGRNRQKGVSSVPLGPGIGPWAWLDYQSNSNCPEEMLFQELTQSCSTPPLYTEAT